MKIYAWQVLCSHSDAITEYFLVSLMKLARIKNKRLNFSEMSGIKELFTPHATRHKHFPPLSCICCPVALKLSSCNQNVFIEILVSQSQLISTANSATPSGVNYSPASVYSKHRGMTCCRPRESGDSSYFLSSTPELRPLPIFKSVL